jgi:hypothetical protein
MLNSQLVDSLVPGPQVSPTLGGTSGQPAPASWLSLAPASTVGSPGVRLVE